MGTDRFVLLDGNHHDVHALRFRGQSVTSALWDARTASELRVYIPHCRALAGMTPFPLPDLRFAWILKGR